MKGSLLLKRVLPIASAISMLAVSLQVAQADLTDPSNNLYGVGTTSYSVMNVSGSAATVVAQYYNPNGSTAATQNLPSLASMGRTNVDVSSVPGLPTAWVGSVVLSSDQDIVAAATTLYTGKNTGADATTASPGTEASAYEAFNTGSTKLYAPALFRLPPPPSNNVAARQVTRYTIQNTTGSTANYTITYRARDGFLLGATTGSLAAYGSKTFETRKDADLPAGLLANLAGRSGGFSAVIDSSQPLAGTSESVANIPSGTILNNWSGDHAMMTPAAASTVLYSPSAFRLCTNTPTAQANCANYANINNFYLSFAQYSSFQLQNTSSQVATVQAQFINRATGAISYTLNFNIAGNSGFGINLFNGGSLPLNSPLLAALGGRFAGSVKFISDRPLVGTGNLDFPAGAATYGSYNLIGDTDATSNIFVPTFNRVCPPATAAQCGSANLPNFQRVSVVQVMNVGASAVTLNGIDLKGPGGANLLTLTQNGAGQPLTLQPGQSVGLNLFNGGDFLISQFNAALGYNFQGTAVVRGPAGAKLKAVVEWRNANIGMDQFNPFNR